MENLPRNNLTDSERIASISDLDESSYFNSFMERRTLEEPVWMYWTSQSGFSWVLAWPQLGAAWLLVAGAEEVAGAAELELEEELLEELAGAESPLTVTASLEPSADPQVVPPGMRDGPTV